MKRMLRRLISRFLHRLERSPRIKLWGRRILERLPRLRGLVIRLMHGGPLLERQLPPNEFDTRSEPQQRLIEDLQHRGSRQR
ncbi:hypothetical protein [Halomonas organivorans]|uniref:Uncharacterized protein n=1 Tax=Halomonas organivorans TaxID=257772 RepID=A0A7W5C1Y5_9GAMM|nr:hypothetical protein [Halomonas organivorans]MBB3142869.1 hypothetical protein [Halomonas organivorans]